MYIGIDLGGTNIAAGIVDDNGRIILDGSTPTLKDRGYEEIVCDMAGLCKSLVAKGGYKMSDIKAQQDHRGQKQATSGYRTHYLGSIKLRFIENSRHICGYQRLRTT